MKTQEPGSQQDVLDDHFGFWNWLKYIGLGTTLLWKYKAAVADHNIQVKGHYGLTDFLNLQVVETWEKINWEENIFSKIKKKPSHDDSISMPSYSFFGCFSLVSML